MAGGLKDNYFSWEAKTPEGKTYAETTMDAIVGVLHADLLA